MDGNVLDQLSPSPERGKTRHASHRGWVAKHATKDRSFNYFSTEHTQRTSSSHTQRLFVQSWPSLSSSCSRARNTNSPCDRETPHPAEPLRPRSIASVRPRPGAGAICTTRRALYETPHSSLHPELLTETNKTRIGDKELSVAPQGIRFATHFTGDIVGFLGKNARFEIVMIGGVEE